MPSNRLLAFASLLALSAFALGCAPQAQAAPPPVLSARPTTNAASTPPQNVGGDRHVYRLDFVLTSGDGTSPATSTAFTLNLQEFDKGEMMVGKNVPLNPAATAGAPGSSGTSSSVPRQDVGLKVAVQWRASGDDLLLDVSTEMSAFEAPSSIRKVVAKGGALASAGKSTVVTTMESDNKKYQLTVTPTKLR